MTPLARSRFRRLTTLVGTLALMGSGLSPAAVRLDQRGLKIVVIEGENAVNVVQQKTAVPPVVEVRDDNDLPVAGAIVTFTVTGGRTATFAGAPSISVTTNAAGRAAVSALNPVTSGAVRIQVQAAFQGQTATTTIVQTNVATAAQAAQAANANTGAGANTGAAGQGGGFPTTLTAVAGAGAVGALVATRYLSKNSPPEICQLLIPAQSGFVDVTRFDLTAEGCDDDGDPVSLSWNLGDGTTATTGAVSHVYRAVGTFPISLSASDGKDTLPPETIATVTIVSSTGRWLLGSSNTPFDLVQSGNQVTGTYTLPSGATGTVSGTLQHPLPVPNLALTLSGPPAGILNANTAGTVDAFNAVVSGGGFPPPFVQTTLTRQ